MTTAGSRPASRWAEGRRAWAAGDTGRLAVEVMFSKAYSGCVGPGVWYVHVRVWHPGSEGQYPRLCVCVCVGGLVGEWVYGTQYHQAQAGECMHAVQAR